VNSNQYILAIDQSTQGTKALLFDEEGHLVHRSDRSHKQIVTEDGWVSHDLEEIYHNLIEVVKLVVEESGVDKQRIVGIGISNQRETSAAWDKVSGKPLAEAIVWQCSRANEICRKIEQLGLAEEVRQITGINLSPYFPASKFAWLIENIDLVAEKAKEDSLCLGTVDTYLLYRLTHGRSFKTDYSNASRTQLFNLKDLRWDKMLCETFAIPIHALAEVCDSNSLFGETDFEGYFEKTIPIHSILGDSHGALFGQGCHQKGMIKSTYGTGSSVMMNIGDLAAISNHGVVTSIAWGMDGRISYVLEGNINYTGAVITWMIDDLNLMVSSWESEAYAFKANPEDTSYLVPAFTGMGAPYWDSEAKGALVGITRKTKKAELIRAGLDSIAYQIVDIVHAMSRDANISIEELRVDGGPTKNRYLMQLQSDLLGIDVLVPEAEELSAIGVAYAAGLALGVYSNQVFDNLQRRKFSSKMNMDKRENKIGGWHEAVSSVLKK